MNCSFMNPSAVTWLFLSQSRLLSLQQMGCPSTAFFVSFFVSFSVFHFLGVSFCFHHISSFKAAFDRAACPHSPISSCSAAVLDVQCSMACSCLYPMVAHLVPGRGNGHQDPASDLKESNQHAAFCQPAGERAVSTQDSRNEGQEV